MRTLDTFRFGWRALVGYPTRTWLTLLAMAIGVSAVVLLTALGEGARRFVIGEFSQLGTHLLIILPGRNETTGGAPPLMGATPRDLTLGDALALLRSPEVDRIAPINVGSAPVAHGALDREATVLGSTADLLPVRKLTLAQGRFLPEGRPDRGRPLVVLGATLKQELFGQTQALGRWVRIGDRRFRVIGVLAKRGQSLGLDLSEVAIVPLASAQALFNSPALFRILVQARSEQALGPAKRAVIDIIRTRHEGEDDVTVITQDALLSTFDGILRALTYAVAGIGAISLLVAGVLIMNVMLVSVSQRTREIGLLKALGAARGQVLRLFLTEAALLAISGAAAGLALSLLGLWLLERLFPSFPLVPPAWAPPAAVMVSLVTGLVFGLLPARRAAGLDPVQALSGR
jgi:putative ABC transport system permease protein